MLKNYTRILIQVFKRNRLSFVFSFLGLIIGITSSILLFHYSFFEMSYDNFHNDKSQIYRIITDNYKNNDLTRSVATTPVPMGKSLKEEISEIEDFARIAFAGKAEVSDKDKCLYEEDILFADASFFKLFNFPIKQGNGFHELDQPNIIYISESFAKKLFGNQNPINKDISIVSFNKKHFCTIKGVFYDLPENSYFKANAFISFQNFYFKWGDQMKQNWIAHFVHTFVKIHPKAKPNDIENKIELLVNKYMADFFKKSNVFRKYKLQPIEDIYLHSDLLYELGKDGNGDSIKHLNILAILIIIISFINFINILSAQSIRRIKETSIRKIVGGSKRYLFKQLLFECFSFGIIITLISILLFFLLKGSVNDLVTKDIEIINTTWYLLIAFMIFISVIPAVYLTLILSPIKPSEVLKGKGNILNNKFLTEIKRALLIFQFIASFCVIFFSLTINKQLKFMNNQDIGINIENTLIIKKPFIPLNDQNSINKYLVFIQELKDYPYVQNISQSDIIPGMDIFSRQRFYKQGNKETDEQYCSVTEVDFNYLENYEFSLLTEDIASKNYYDNKIQAIINEEAARLFKYEKYSDAVGDILIQDNRRIEIVGVIKNYHQQSLKNPYIPTVMIIEKNPSLYISIKYNEKGYNAFMKQIKTRWKNHFPNSPLQCYDLKEFFQKEYTSEIILKKFITILSVLLIIISFLGISGISLSDINGKVKEIGIRKILGSSIVNIFYVISKSYFVIFGISVIIGTVLNYLLIESWLTKFAFRISFPWRFNIYPAIFLLLMIIFVLGTYIFKVSSSHPEKAIRE